LKRKQNLCLILPRGSLTITNWYSQEGITKPFFGFFRSSNPFVLIPFQSLWKKCIFVFYWTQFDSLGLIVSQNTLLKYLLFLLKRERISSHRLPNLGQIGTINYIICYFEIFYLLVVNGSKMGIVSKIVCFLNDITKSNWFTANR
jgi:hypothetical protein